MKVILCGFNWVGCKALDILLENKHEVFVFTHESPYYVNDLIGYCQKRKVEYSTDKISADNLPFIPDVIASIYYRYIISESVINACQGRIFNLHPSLLPDYRGCSSLTWAMIQGETKVGYTYHYLTSKVDCGNVLVQKEIALEEFDTQISLYYRVMFEAIKDFYPVLQLVQEGYTGKEQDLSKGKHFKRGAPYNGCIDPEWDAGKTERFIKAMIFPPLPPATFQDNPVFSMNELTALRERQRKEEGQDV